ncbi:1-aminocyclopropane-1-carboxylate synthase-like [Zingiber officinale]|uniref:Aminotransferase class I/classII large domain-containing protein n=1 Tax=Zingiber officinale TaxID=94328 RepID=A0A8J5FRE4_ZINOF|nr:1-aminocyclopropane-1-carboxylate synthase-like [Zingiber officinale]KAG6490206.1 hypothetical protein ZIOFF_051491 [Zingiber officinale]
MEVHDEVSSHYQVLSRMATCDGHGENSCYFDGWKAYDEDPFHPTKNSNGVIQMGLAENQLCLELIQEWIKKNPQASICTKEGVSDFKDIANFQDYHGLQDFREAIALFMEKVRGGKVKFDPDRIVMSGGATGAQETLAFCLANPGQAFLVPTPYYPAFDRDFQWRTGVKLLPIHCDSSNNFKITKTALVNAFQDARNSGITVKGILVTNPSNPLGTVMDTKTLRTLVSFACEKRIHLICDEVFSGTVFGEPEYVSVAAILDEVSPHCDRTLFHIAYSLSKDLGVPGFRVGIIYSFNDAVVRCARRMSSFGLVSTQTQRLLANMLRDDHFTTNLLAENKRRLRLQHQRFTAGLSEVGIHCLDGSAGLFCWMNLQWMLKAETVAAELELWRVIIYDVKLNISPGSSFHCSEPGWFRVCFANMDEETMEAALERIRRFVQRTASDKPRTIKSNKKRWRPSRRLSVPPELNSITVMSPRLISPRPPLDQTAN